jgi:arylsulfatase A-like enzyme
MDDGSATVPADGMTPEHNVLVFIIDDVGKEPFSCYDNTTYNPASPGSRVDPLTAEWANQWDEAAQDDSEYAYPPTPITLALAKDGLLLERMHVPAMCSPMRASILTGRSGQQHTLGDVIQAAQSTDDDGTPFKYQGKTYYELMDDQGSDYERLHIGKWHISEHYAALTTFDEVTASFKAPVTQGHATYYEGSLVNLAAGAAAGYSSTRGDHTEYPWTRYDVRESPVLVTGNAAGPFAGETGLAYDGWYETDTHSLIKTVEAAIAAIEKAASDEKPFVMTVMIHMVHVPLAWAAMGGAALSAAGYHSYGASDPGSEALRRKAALESADTALGLIRAAMTTAQAAKTNTIVISDNGSTTPWLEPDATADTLEPTKPAVPASDYDDDHVKRSGYQGGISAACVIHGPGVVSPGDGSVPRVWSGLCGVEDVFDLVCYWTGTRHAGDTRYDTTVLRNAVNNTAATGRATYVQRQFINGFVDDPTSDDAENGDAFSCAQNGDGWKLLWAQGGSWELYDLPNDPVEATDLFDAASGGTVQAKYGNLTGTQQGHFDELYTTLLRHGLVPEALEIVLD